MRVLVVEDDVRVGSALATVLRHHGFSVRLAHTAREGLEDLIATPADVVLLDLGLPDQDGFEVCGQIRRTSDVPVIVVTARAQPRARIHGLNLGADDYVVKPYNLGELIARIHAVTRRVQVRLPAHAPPGGDPILTLTVGDLRIDLRGRHVEVADRPVTLTRKEFDLLALLAREPGVVFRREQILSEVWHTASAGAGRSLEVHVASLRSKLGPAVVIETVRGLGYRLVGA